MIPSESGQVARCAAGTPKETVQRHTVILKKQDEAVEVCKVAF
jgi:hypothetical protein